MEGVRLVCRRLDAAVFQVERALLVVALGMMTVLVAVDVTQRTFSRPVGKTASILLGVLPSPSAATQALVVEWVGPLVFGVLSLGFVVLAVQARRGLAAAPGAPRPGFGVSVAAGAVLWLAGAGAIEGLLWLFPSSVPGAQKFALGFMLWAGMLGASLAARARRHIVLDAVVKKLEGRTQRWFLLLSGLVTAGFCALLGWLGALQVADQVTAWASGDGVGVYDALPVPTWIATLAVPVTFFVMAARFAGHGVHDLVWGPPRVVVDALGVDLEAVTGGAAGGGEAGKP